MKWFWWYLFWSLVKVFTKLFEMLDRLQCSCFYLGCILLLVWAMVLFKLSKTHMEVLFFFNITLQCYHFSKFVYSIYLQSSCKTSWHDRFVAIRIAAKAMSHNNDDNDNGNKSSSNCRNSNNKIQCVSIEQSQSNRENAKCLSATVGDIYRDIARWCYTY